VPSLLRAPLVLQQVYDLYLLQALQRLLAGVLRQSLLHRLLPLHGLRRPDGRTHVRPDVRTHVWPPLLAVLPAMLPGSLRPRVHERRGLLSAECLRRAGVVQQHRLL
jgi:hypothetical protein